MYPLIFDNISIFYGASKKYKDSFFGFPKGEIEWYIHLPHFICMIFLLSHHYSSISVYPQVNVQIPDILVYGRNPASVSFHLVQGALSIHRIHSIIANPMIMGIYYYNEDMYIYIYMWTNWSLFWIIPFDCSTGCAGSAGQRHCMAFGERSFSSRMTWAKWLAVHASLTTCSACEMIVLPSSLSHPPCLRHLRTVGTRVGTLN